MELPLALQINVAARHASDAVPHTTRAALQRGARRVYRYVIPLFFPALLCVLFYSPLLLVSLGSVPLVLFLRWLAFGSPVPLTRANALVLALAAAVLWAMVRAPSVYDTGLVAARLVVSITLFFLVVDYAEHPARLWNVAAGVVLFGAATALLAPFLTTPSPDKLVDVSALFHPRLFGLQISNPNMIGGALAAILPLALALIFNSDKRLRWIGSVSLAPMVVMLWLLQSRGAWLGAFFGVLLFFSLYRRGLVFMLPLGIFVVILLYAYAEDLAAALPFHINISNVFISLQGRQQVWDFSAREILREPFGHGLNAYTAYAENLASDLLTTPQRQHAHNLFLQIGFETGLVGLGAFAALCAYALYATWHALTRAVKRDLALGVFAALCAALASDLLEANMWGNKAALVLWTLFGMAVVLGRYGARRRHTLRGKSLSAGEA